MTGWENTGKTTPVERRVARFATSGLAVASVKRARHAARDDLPGTGSVRHRVAGARQVLLVTPDRWSPMTEIPEPPLDALPARLEPPDLVLVEGDKHAPHPVIERHHAAAARAGPIAAGNAAIRALASDAPGAPVVFALDDIAGLAGFIGAGTDLRA